MANGDKFCFIEEPSPENSGGLCQLLTKNICNTVCAKVLAENSPFEKNAEIEIKMNAFFVGFFSRTVNS